MAIISLLMPSSIRSKIDQYIARRNPGTTGKIELHHRRIYILPTRFGYIYALMLLVLFLAAINYQNSMAYMLTFLLCAIAVISLWQTHKNLLGLTVELKPPHPVFQNEPLSFNFKIENALQSSRYAVGIQYQQEIPSYTRIQPQDDAEISLHVTAPKRGLYKLAGFNLFSRYPTGLFHAWSWLKFDTPVLIYPHPQFDHVLEESLMEQNQGKNTLDMADGDDFAGLREHREGESLRHISWKAYAQGRGMLTKTFQGHANPSLWINWSDMSAGSVEGKLSQMTALVLRAQQDGRKYGVNLPGLKIEQETGASHQANCLQQLAIFQQRDIESELPLHAE